MSDYKNDEVDIFYVFNKFKELLNRGNVLVFRAINFIIKKWVIIIILLIAGGAFGYYTKKNTKQDKKAIVLLRINFDTVNYVYTSLELLNEKVLQNDYKFLSKIGFETAIQEIKSIEINPIINLKEIVNQFEVNNRNFETALKNIDFNVNDEEIQISETFNSDYKYHMLYFILTNNANEETLHKIISYLNNNELLQQLKEVTNKDIREHVKNNIETISQINKILDTYTSNESLASPSSQIFVVDRDFKIANIIAKKMELQREIEELNKFLVYSKDIVLMVNKPNITLLNRGIIDKKVIIYPIMFVFTFLFFAFLRFIYISLRDLSNQTEEEIKK